MTRRPRRRRATGNRRRDTGILVRLGWVALAVLVVAGFAAIFLAQWYLRPEGVDEHLCPKKTGPAAGLAILLDLTDELNRTQHNHLSGKLDRRVKDAESNTLISVGAVRADVGRRGAEFARCKPLQGKEANDIYENPRLIEERYQAEFRRPFDAIVQEMLDSPAADRSPIMESLQALLVGTPGFVDADYPRRLIIASDLIQHSRVFSFYRGDTWDRFIRSPDARRLAGGLEGVEVEICRVPRPGARVDMRQVDHFWVKYLEQAGVSRVLATTCRLGDL